jgi:hypothetical protein
MKRPLFGSKRRAHVIAGFVALAALLIGATLFSQLFLTAKVPAAPVIVTGPANPTSAATATFTFTDSTSGVAFHCSLDHGGYSSCTSGKRYTDLSNGTHTFRVTATKGGSDPSGPATYTWVVDTGVPVEGEGSSAAKAGPLNVAFQFPVDSGQYQATAWNAGCSPAGLCGTASDVLSVSTVKVSVLQQSSGKYWNGSSFGSSTEALNAATLHPPAGRSTRWAYALSLPPDGSYRAHVVATDPLGNAGKSGSQATITFRIGAPVAPPPPVISGGPDNPTFATTAEFGLTDAVAGVTFLCSLDNGPFIPCGDPENDRDADFSNLAIGDHTLRVEAVDATGNTSAPASFSWTILANRTFGISGSISQFFSPGVTLPANLSLANPYNFDLKVVSVSITVQHATTKNGSPNSGCDGPTNLVITQPFSGPVTVARETTQSLSQLGVPQAKWPQVQMLDLSTNQDACKGTTFTLTYTGTATKANP